MSEINEILNRIEAKLDKHGEDLTSIRITQAEQHITLEEHVRRSNMLEDLIKPLRKRYDQVNGALRALGIIAAIIAALGAIGGVIEGLVTLLEYLGVKG